MSGQDAIDRLDASVSDRYRIDHQIGEGGMATVYLAEDLKHKRRVALKVLKPELAAVAGAERFLAEIETTASLQHPNILPLFDSGEADGSIYFVMPYLEDETLRERLDRERQLPVDEAVRIAEEVAEALDYAHRQGVIHRDIKPANILLRDGRPLIADFGIALAASRSGGEARLSETGMSLGTPYYMSPEQATGDQRVGPATDIYALGCVLYEMLVGEPPYTGSTPQAVLGKIVTGEAPSARAERRSVPPNVDAAIRRTLERLPADRFTSARDVGTALADRSFRHGALASSADHSSAVWQTAALLAVGLGVGVVAAGLVLGGEAQPARGDVMRFTIRAPENTAVDLYGNHREVSISPDGRLIVYQTGEWPTDAILNVRPIGEVESAQLQGTEAGASAFFSPDGEWVGFEQSSPSSDALLKVSVSGGPPVTVVEWDRPIRGASWSVDDRIVFGTTDSGLFSVPGGGGEPEPLTTLDMEHGETAHFSPRVVDGHDVVLFVINHGIDPNDLMTAGELAALDLVSGEVTRLGLVGVSPRYTSTGHLVYAASDSTIRAVPFDVDGLTVTGSPVPVVENVVVKNWFADFDVSLNGRLVYVPGVSGGLGPRLSSAPANLVLVNRDGSGRSLLANLESAGNWPRFSEDGARISYEVDEDRTEMSDLWVLDVERGSETRVTFGEANDLVPIWSTDGDRLVYAHGNGPDNRLMSTAADGSGQPEVVLDVGDRAFPSSLSPDGRTLMYYEGGEGSSFDVWMLSLDGGEAGPQPYIETPFNEAGAIFSPDGRWIAYVSDRSGQTEVYARSFPGPGEDVTVSVGGGSEPRWGADGTELYYRTEAELMVVSVDPDSPSLSARTPRRVMADGYRRSPGSGAMANYDITPDGEAFVMVEDAGDEGIVHPEVRVVLNWLDELLEQVPID